MTITLRKKKVLETPIFSKIVSRDRLKLTSKCLHFIELETVDEILYKISTLLNVLIGKFKANYIPGKYVSFDGCFWKGDSGAEKFIPSKRARVDNTSYILVEFETGPVSNKLM